MLGGIGGVTFASQFVGSIGGAVLLAGAAVYGVIDRVFGFRMSPDDKRRGTDLSIHKIGARRFPYGRAFSR
jgi:ammonium transporter, Amt family